MVMIYPFFLLPRTLCEQSQTHLFQVAEERSLLCSHYVQRNAALLRELRKISCSGATPGQDPLAFPMVSRQSFCKFTANSELENKLKGKRRASNPSHIEMLKYLQYFLRFCCGYLTSEDSSIMQGMKSKEEVVLPCACCLSSCCFPLSSSSPSLFPHNTSS